ncbi:flippase [Empedobacter falsenii]
MLKVKGVKINYILNITRTVLSTLIGLLIFPYINKTLGVQAVGKYEYANSIITYFILFSSLGIPMYGIREIAKVRDSEKKRTEVVLELLAILFITTIISYLFFFFLILYTDGVSNYKELLLIISPTIFLTSIGLEWFFQGIEDQLYITVRFLIVKIITLVLLFTMVNNSDDLLIYAGIMAFSLGGSNIFNFFYIRKFLNFSQVKYKELDIKRHFKGVLTIFLATISISIYIQLDTTLLGYYAGDKYVGLYTTANKLVRFAILFVTTLGAVMLPRLSYLYENNQKEEYYNYLEKSFKYILFFSVPIVVLLYSLSDSIIYIMAGEEFAESVVSMKILSSLVLVIGLAYFLAFMVLYPQGKERLYTIIVFITALISLFLNVYFIPKYFHIATSWVNLSVEIIAVVIMMLITRKELKRIKCFNITNLYYFIGGIIMFFLVDLLKIFIENVWITIITTSILGGLIYVAFLLLVKEKTLLEVVYKLKQKIKQ